MQPYLWFLIYELLIFYMAVLGDVYTTNALIGRYGLGIEANPRVRKMYLNGSLLLSWASVFAFSLCYGVLALIGIQPIPYAPFASVLGGLLITCIPVVNTVRGALVFQQLRKGSA